MLSRFLTRGCIGLGIATAVTCLCTASITALLSLGFPILSLIAVGSFLLANFISFMTPILVRKIIENRIKAALNTFRHQIGAPNNLMRWLAVASQKFDPTWLTYQFSNGETLAEYALKRHYELDSQYYKKPSITQRIKFFFTRSNSHLSYLFPAQSHAAGLLHLSMPQPEQPLTLFQRFLSWFAQFIELKFTFKGDPPTTEMLRTKLIENCPKENVGAIRPNRASVIPNKRLTQPALLQESIREERNTPQRMLSNDHSLAIRMGYPVKREKILTNAIKVEETKQTIGPHLHHWVRAISVVQEVDNNYTQTQEQDHVENQQINISQALQTVNEIANLDSSEISQEAVQFFNTEHKEHSHFYQLRYWYQHLERFLQAGHKVKYKICLANNDGKPGKDEIHVKKIGDKLAYTLITPKGELVTDFIIDSRYIDAPKGDLTPDKLLELEEGIQKAAFYEGHTDRHRQIKLEITDEAFRIAKLGADVFQNLGRMDFDIDEHIPLGFKIIRKGDVYTLVYSKEEREKGSALTKLDPAGSTEIMLSLMAKRYRICLAKDGVTPEENEIHVRKIGDKLAYTVITPQGERVENVEMKYLEIPPGDLTPSALDLIKKQIIGRAAVAEHIAPPKGTQQLDRWNRDNSLVKQLQIVIADKKITLTPAQQQFLKKLETHDHFPVSGQGKSRDILWDHGIVFAKFIDIIKNTRPAFFPLLLNVLIALEKRTWTIRREWRRDDDDRNKEDTYNFRDIFLTLCIQPLQNLAEFDTPIGLQALEGLKMTAEDSADSQSLEKLKLLYALLTSNRDQNSDWRHIRYSDYRMTSCFVDKWVALSNFISFFEARGMKIPENITENIFSHYSHKDQPVLLKLNQVTTCVGLSPIPELQLKMIRVLPNELTISKKLLSMKYSFVHQDMSLSFTDMRDWHNSSWDPLLKEEGNSFTDIPTDINPERFVELEWKCTAVEPLNRYQRAAQYRAVYLRYVAGQVALHKVEEALDLWVKLTGFSLDQDSSSDSDEKKAQFVKTIESQWVKLRDEVLKFPTKISTQVENESKAGVGLGLPVRPKTESEKDAKYSPVIDEQKQANFIKQYPSQDIEDLFKRLEFKTAGLAEKLKAQVHQLNEDADKYSRYSEAEIKQALQLAKTSIQDKSKTLVDYLGLIRELHYRYTANMSDDNTHGKEAKRVKPKKKKKGQWLRLEQIVTILAGLEQDCLFQNETSEGKTLIINLIAILKALSGKKTDVITHSETFAENGANQIQFLAQLFDLKIAEKKHKAAQIIEADILFIDAATAVINDKLAQFNEEEKKALAGQRKAESVVVDEVCNVVIDIHANTTMQISNSATVADAPFEQFLMKLNTAVRNLNASDVKEKDQQREYVRKELKSPDFEKYFKDDQELDRWMTAAITAMQLRKNRDYIIQDNQVRIVHYKTTGRVDKVSKWGEGVHSCVAAWEKLKPHDGDINVKIPGLSEVVAEGDIENFLKKYNEGCYFTGTFGSQTVIDEMRAILEPEECIAMPRAKRDDLPEATWPLVANKEDKYQNDYSYSSIQAQLIPLLSKDEAKFTVEEGRLLLKLLLEGEKRLSTFWFYQRWILKPILAQARSKFNKLPKNLKESIKKDGTKPIYNRTYRFPPVFELSKKDHFIKLFEAIENGQLEEKSSLMFFNTIEECQEFYDFLISNGINFKNIQILDDTSSDSGNEYVSSLRPAEKIVIEDAKTKKKITLTTAAGSRGTDFNSISRAILAKPGLLRVILQELGRVGRNGELGIVHEIYCVDDLDEEAKKIFYEAIELHKKSEAKQLNDHPTPVAAAAVPQRDESAASLGLTASDEKTLGRAHDHKHHEPELAFQKKKIQNKDTNTDSKSVPVKLKEPTKSQSMERKGISSFRQILTEMEERLQDRDLKRIQTQRPLRAFKHKVQAEYVSGRKALPDAKQASNVHKHYTAFFNQMRRASLEQSQAEWETFKRTYFPSAPAA